MTRGGKAFRPKKYRYVPRKVYRIARYASIISVGASTRPGSGPGVRAATATRAADAHERRHPLIAHERPTATIVTARHTGSAQHIAVQIRRAKDVVDHSIPTNTTTRPLFSNRTGLRSGSRVASWLTLALPAKGSAPSLLPVVGRCAFLMPGSSGRWRTPLLLLHATYPASPLYPLAWAMLAMESGDTGDPTRHDTNGIHRRCTGESDFAHNPPIFRTKIYR